MAFDDRIFIAHPEHELFSIRTDPEVGVIVERIQFEHVPAEEIPVFYTDDLMEQKR